MADTYYDRVNNVFIGDRQSAGFSGGSYSESIINTIKKTDLERSKLDSERQEIENVNDKRSYSLIIIIITILILLGIYIKLKK